MQCAHPNQKNDLECEVTGSKIASCRWSEMQVGCKGESVEPWEQLDIIQSLSGTPGPLLALGPLDIISLRV